MNTSLNDFTYNVSYTLDELTQEAKDLLRKTAAIEKIVNSLSFSDFNKMVLSANEIITKSFGKTGLNIHFACSPTPRFNVFWRITATIRCIITESDGVTVLSHRVLTLREFVVLYQEIQRFTELPTKISKPKCDTVDSEICVLCCDACPSAILPCGHNFCRKCVDEWFKPSFKLPAAVGKLGFPRYFARQASFNNREQCPLCREPCSRNTEAWDLLDHPDSSECRREMAAVLINLICKAGTPLF